MAAATILRLDEAVDLGHAWLQSLADERGIRILFLKGPALHRHGLRAPRTSSDVDVLVEPARFADFCADVLAAGCTERDAILISELTTLHSRTFVRDGWPCDIDVHSFYPGFLADPAVAFGALWRRRVAMEFAHRACTVPDRVSGVLVLALHSLRGASIQERHGDELQQLVAIELTDQERSDVAALALATGSAATLETVLPRLGIEVAAPAGEESSDELRRWRERVAAGSHGAYFWISAFLTAPPAQRPRIALRALWPTRRDLLIARPDTVDSLSGRTRARLARMGRGIRWLPRALRAFGPAARAPRERA
ncbi:nucleotidyltransferase family protein [Microbacterium sp. SS28]|uniref:nucleotidyltransferase family protein n=1 Tax=Microbacterium sp. SS28 TaxID=2919948 RepID=UPI001FAA4831|nr:nucleotidyltransferase family protein [Microbacterium sp. SS28]